jgi:crotonobetainyl-CoA:carnitine CoA-transferase CaiB-like acyl-CoA transferase
VADYGARGFSPGRSETYLVGRCLLPCHATRDGRHVAHGAIEDKFWRSFCEAADRREWIARQAEPMPQETLIADLAGYFERLTLAECIARFAAADCCLTPVLTVGEALESEHCRYRGLVRRSPSGALQALFPARVDEEPPASRPSPRTTPR